MNTRFLAAIILTVFTKGAHADTSSYLPGAGFQGDRYSILWTKSPFSIATPDAMPTSTDYSMVGMAQFDGVTYLSLVDKQTQEHFVLTNAKPVRNLTLVSINGSGDGASAVIQRRGETLTLRIEHGPDAAPMSTPLVVSAPNRSMINAPLSNVGGVISPAFIAPPQVRTHRLLNRIPPRPQAFSLPPPSQPQAATPAAPQSPTQAPSPPPVPQ